MARIKALFLVCFAGGCAANGVSQDALCTGTATDRKAHAAALVKDGGPESQGTGVTLLGKFERGCAE